VVKYKKLIFTIFTRIGNTGFGALSAVAVAANFGEVGLGLFALFRTLPMFLMILTEMGVSHSYSFLINGKEVNREKVLFNGITFGVFVGVLQVFLWFFISPYVIEHFSMPVSKEIIIFLAGVAPLMVFQLHFVNYLRAISSIYKANINLISVEFCIAVFFCCVWFLEINDNALLVYGILIPYLLINFFMLIYFIKSKYIVLTGFDLKILKLSFNFGVKSQLANAFQILNYRLDQVIVASIVGPGMLGVYVVATKAAELFRFFSLSIVFVLEPLISKKTSKESYLLVKKYYVPILLLNSVIILLGFFIGPILIPIFFDNWSADSITPFYILMIGLLFTGANGLIGAFSLGQGKPELNTYAIGVALVFTVTLDVLLIPQYGVVGAAVASTTGFFISSCAFLYFFIKESKKNEIIK